MGDEDDYQLVSEEAIKEMQVEVLSKDTTEFVPAQIKNVLFCGASKSGKSTIFNILQNPCYCPAKISLFADTKFTSFKTFSLKDRVKGTVHNYVINLIDTPGTFEVRASKEEFKQRGNDEIAGLIVDCINHEITYLNLLVLVISATKFSTTEIESVDLFLAIFGETSVPIVLCLTHADQIGARRRDEIEESLKELNQKPESDMTEEDLQRKEELGKALTASSNVLSNYSAFHKLVSEIKELPSSQMSTEKKELILSRWM